MQTEPYGSAASGAQIPPSPHVAGVAVDSHVRTVASQLVSGTSTVGVASQLPPAVSRAGAEVLNVAEVVLMDTQLPGDRLHD